MGAWIETVVNSKQIFSGLTSLPIWERGLKRSSPQLVDSVWKVAPYMGAWIETSDVVNMQNLVVPSLPIWERGLKRNYYNLPLPTHTCRSLYGSVD